MDRALVLNNVKSLTRGNIGIPVMLMDEARVLD
jgi:flagellar biosynthesis protein FlhA